MDIFNDDMSVDQIVSSNLIPTTNTSWERGIEIFDRKSWSFKRETFSNIVTGYVDCTKKSPLEVLRQAAKVWETQGVQGLHPWYIRTDFGPKENDYFAKAEDRGLRFRASGEGDQKHKTDSQLGHKTPHDCDPFPQNVDINSRVPDSLAASSSPPLYMTALAASVSSELSMNVIVVGDPYDDVRSDRSKCVIVPVVSIQNREIKWSFMGSVYNWRVLQMVRFSSCDTKSQELLHELCTPVVRRWASTLQDAADDRSSGYSSSSGGASETWIRPGTRL